MSSDSFHFLMRDLLGSPLYQMAPPAPSAAHPVALQSPESLPAGSPRQSLDGSGNASFLGGLFGGGREEATLRKRCHEYERKLREMRELASCQSKLAETKLATEVGRTKLARADASEKGAKVVELEGELASPAVLFRRLRVVLVARARAAAGRAKSGTISAARATGSAVGDGARATRSAVGDGARATGSAVGNGARATRSAVGRGAAKTRAAASRAKTGILAAARATRSAVSTDAAVKTLDAARADAARDDLPKTANGAKGGAPQ